MKSELFTLKPEVFYRQLITTTFYSLIKTKVKGLKLRYYVSVKNQILKGVEVNAITLDQAKTLLTTAGEVVKERRI